ncbi:hypothetical protein Dfri01_59930 [Dyadobacter frigoris]|nr:hypothetical protein Dfri01_59930 [Dyadobacter frigoris]
MLGQNPIFALCGKDISATDEDNKRKEYSRKFSVNPFDKLCKSAYKKGLKSYFLKYSGNSTKPDLFLHTKLARTI